MESGGLLVHGWCIKRILEATVLGDGPRQICGIRVIRVLLGLLGFY